MTQSAGTVIERVLPQCALHRIGSRHDVRGTLIALEAHAEVPFGIERVYYLFGLPTNSERGFHAHRDLDQMMICVSGGCTIVVEDSEQRREVRLDSPNLALHIGSVIWREMKDFTPDCVIMVLASKRYDESDYIREYDDFKKLSRAL